MTGEDFPGDLPKGDGCGWIWFMKSEPLTKRRVAGVDDPLFLDSLDIYRTSFPVHEQRRIQDFPLAFQDPGFCYEVFLNGEGRVVAMLVTWRRENSCIWSILPWMPPCAARVPGKGFWKN